MAMPQLHTVTLKVLMYALIIFFVPVVLIPVGLYVAGVNIFSRGATSGGTSAETGNLIRSENGGETWEFATQSEESEKEFPSVILDIVSHPQYPDMLILGAKGAGLWKSSNLGTSWSRMTDESGALRSDADVYRVAVSPSSPNIMYVAAYQQNRGRVFRSDTFGRSFQETYRTTADKFGVFDMAIDPSDADRLMIITGQGGLLESVDGGRTWRVRRWFPEALQQLIVNPSQPSDMYLLTASAKLLKSADGGERWAELRVTPRATGTGASPDLGINYPPDVFGGGGDFFGGFSRPTPDSVAGIDPNNPLRLYVGSNDGLLRSEDGGLTWERLSLLIPPEALPVTAVAVHPFNQQIIYAGALNQLHQSTDQGIHWKVQNLATNLRIRRIFIHPEKPEIMLVMLGK